MEDGDEWVSAAQAVALLRPLFKLPDAAQEAIIDRAAGGLIPSRALQIVYESQGDGGTSPARVSIDRMIAASFWRNFDNLSNRRSERWATGDFILGLLSDSGSHLTRVLGVEFSERAVRSMLSAAPAAEPPKRTVTEALDAMLIRGANSLHRLEPPRVAPSASGMSAPELAAHAKALGVDVPEPPEAAPETPEPLPPRPESPLPDLQPDRAKSPVSDAHLQAWWTFYRAVRLDHLRTEEDMAAHFARCFTDKSVTRARLRTLRGRQKSGPKARPAE